MKKTNIFKIVMTLVMAFIVTGAFAQVAGGDYSEYDSDTETPTAIDYVTVGTDHGYYAMPDNVYHPNYDAGNGWALTAGFVWNWTVDAEPNAGDASITYPVGGMPANYVEINYGELGNYTINVAEQAPLSFGGCADATPTVMNVTAIAAPTAGIVGADANNTWTEVTAGYEYYICGDAAAENLTITITETGVPAALASYAYSVEQRIVNIDASDNDIGGTETITPDFVDHTITGKYATATADGGSETVSTGAMPVVGGERTKYEYTIKTATDYTGAGGEGIISAISHKSDYLTVAGGGEITTYPFTGTAVTVTYIVNPAPTTGPVYHIPNDFSI